MNSFLQFHFSISIPSRHSNVLSEWFLKTGRDPSLGPLRFSKLLNFTSSRVYIFDAIVQDNVFLILHTEFQRFIIAYDILMSTVTFHWSYPTVINSSVLYKRRQSLSKCRKMQTALQSYEWCYRSWMLILRKTHA